MFPTFFVCHVDGTAVRSIFHIEQSISGRLDANKQQRHQCITTSLGECRVMLEVIALYLTDTLMNIAFFLFLACSPKKKEDLQATTVQSIAKPEDSDCPPGVKIACNVPTMTQNEINAMNAKNEKCVQECVRSRQMESIDHTMIEEQCQQTCNQEHFVGQVQVAPRLPHEVLEPKKKSDSQP